METWFTEQQAGLIGGAIGTFLGAAGGIIGAASGLCVRKNWKKALYFACSVCIAFSAVLLFTGMFALFYSQPRHVWYVFLLPGIIGTAVMTGILPAVRNRFREQEFRRMQAKDM